MRANFRCMPLAIGLCSLALIASTSGPPTVDEPVVVWMAHGDRRAGAIEAAVAAQLSDLPIALRVVRCDRCGSSVGVAARRARGVLAERRPALVLWVASNAPSELYVLVPDEGGGRLLIREIPPRSGVSMYEALAVITRHVVEAVLAGIIELELEPRPRPASDKPETRAGSSAEPEIQTSSEAGPRASPISVSAGAGYRLRWYARGSEPTHEGVVLVGLLLAPGWTIWAGTAYAETVPLRSDVISAELRRLPFWLGVEHSITTGSFEWLAQLGASLERDSVSIESVAQPLVPSSQRHAWHLAGMGHLGLRYRPAEHVALQAAVGVDRPWAAYAYQVVGPSGPETLLAAHSWQPYVTLAIQYTL